MEGDGAAIQTDETVHRTAISRLLLSESQLKIVDPGQHADFFSVARLVFGLEIDLGDTNGKGWPETNVNLEGSVFAQDTIHSSTNNPKHEKESEQQGALQHSEPLGEVNMEAVVSSDDVIRAGGFGARDGLSSVLPIASDSTDFESSLLDMREYEEPQGEKCRPGLGWSEDKESD